MSAPKKTVLLSSFFFVSSALIFWFLTGMRAPSGRFVATARDCGFASFSGLLRTAAGSAASVTAEALAVFFSGFTVFPVAVPCAVLLFRGACFGASLRAFSGGALSFSEETLVFGISQPAAVFSLYAISSLSLIFFSYFSVLYSERMRGKEKATPALGYAAVSAVFFGGLVILDLLRFAAVR
ncbi:MAG: hypothetical protein IJS78_02795 [Clostridia bacterium]|nr:hypothetical protein [Clostridia bacterium]